MASGDRVIVQGVDAPLAPSPEIDRLIAFMSDSFPSRKENIVHLINVAKQLKNKEDVIRLGYELLLFRMELDEWVAFSERLLDQGLADQLDSAHSELAGEARERGSARPSAELVKSRAKQYTAPLREANSILKSTRDWMANALSWCQSQQRVMASDEYGELFSGNNQIPEDLFEVERPPSVGQALRRNS